MSDMGLGMGPMMHPLIRNGQMDAPESFAMIYPAITAMGFLMLHVLFGVLVGAFYTALI